MSPRFASMIALALTLGAAAARSQELSAERVATDLDAPMTVAAPPGDARLFIVERAGTIRVLQNGSVLPGAFLDIRGDVETNGEGGLLGLAFAPDFYDSGQFFVYYTAPDATAGGDLESRLSRFIVTGTPATSNDANEASEQILYQLDQPAANHNGGTLAIRDGWLYLGLGDGGGGGGDRAQDDAQDFGKMLRFDLDDVSVPWEPEHWAKGLRNPFRFSFDRETADLYIGDVGQNAFEEIDVERADSPGGRNYGWDVEEGSSCYDSRPALPCGDPSLVRPVFEYAHVGSGWCSGSVTGGSVYRGSAYPALDGLYLFADYCRHKIWSLRWNRSTGEAEEVVERTGTIDVTPQGAEIEDITAIAEDGFGELYFVDAGGELFRLVPEPGAGAAAVAAAALGSLAALRRRRNERVR
ncbi:MAG: PQQ-dependent sugar dehydrogenase [Deltaproteobacteria bacterium]|nr:PQQ-dependent sugar dehydrogenase [Deltaproteobacteria bacterium]